MANDGPGGGIISPEVGILVSSCLLSAAASVVIATALAGTLSTPALVAAGLATVLLLGSMAMSPADTADRRRRFGRREINVAAPGEARDSGAEEGQGLSSRDLRSYTQLAVVFKIVMSWLHVKAIDVLYGGVADLNAYHRFGEQYADMARGGGIEAISYGGTGTSNFINTMGWLYVFLGTNFYFQCALFSLIALAGALMSAAAARRVLAPRHHRRATLLILFAPSLLFWNATIGKDAFIAPGIGAWLLGSVIALDERRPTTGLPLAAAGIAWVAPFRPHVTMAMMLASFMGLLAHRAPNRQVRGRASKPVLIAVATVGLLLAASQFESAIGVQLNASELQQAGVDTEEIRTNTNAGTLLVGAGAITNPIQIPMAVFTALFRPIVFDVAFTPSVALLIQSLEGTALLAVAGWAVVRRKEWWARVRSSETLSACVFYLLICGVGFASFNNAGTLARQRTQWLAALIILLCTVDWSRPTAAEKDAAALSATERTLPLPSNARDGERRPANMW